MPLQSSQFAVRHDSIFTPSNAAVDELAAAHAHTLEKAVAGEFERQTRRMPFATPARVCGLAAELLHDFAEDLLNDLLMLADRRGTPAAEWVMGQLSEALVTAATALEEASPSGARLSVSNVLQICRVDFEWRCRARLGLPSTTTLEIESGPAGPANDEESFDRGGIR
jgi:hypothetical protein